MPVIAVVAAVAIDAGAIGALAAGTLTTLAAVTAIGATLGAIGAVTGNKTLSLVGGAIGIVGGIGSLAFGSGALGNVSDLFGSSASMSAADTASLASGAQAAADTALEGIPGAAGAAAASDAADITASTGAINMSAITPNAAIEAAAAPAEGDAAAIAGGAPGSALREAIAPGATTAEASTTVNGPTQMNAFRGPGPDFDVNNPAPLAKAGWGYFDSPSLASGAPHITGAPIDLASLSSPGFETGGGILNWAKDNQLLSYGILQAGGSFISGLTNPMTPAQIEALSAQAAENRAAAALLERQTANQGQPLPTATAASPPVTGKPAPTGGLINNSRLTNTPLITGAPNTGAQPVPAGASV